MFRILKLCTLILWVFSSCSVTNRMKGKEYIYVQKENRESAKWKLVWQDDFTGAEIDESRWTRIPPGGSDWNRHMSTDDACFKLENGELHLLGINNPDTVKDSRPYITGGIWSVGKFAFQYGRVEIRAKLENAQGAWPAMWMLAELNKYGNYPKNGEIDIMEHLNSDTIIYQITHSHYTLELGKRDNPPNSGTATINPGEYNVYGLSWYPDRLVFQVNGKDTFTYPRVEGVDPSQWPYDQPFYLLIDQQLGGEWVGKVATKQLPVAMIIDWVKVYQ